MDNVEIVGTIRFFNERSFERKKKDDESIVKTYYSFTLVDSTGKMNCVLFPHKSDI